MHAGSYLHQDAVIRAKVLQKLRNIRLKIVRYFINLEFRTIIRYFINLQYFIMDALPLPRVEDSSSISLHRYYSLPFL